MKALSTKTVITITLLLAASAAVTIWAQNQIRQLHPDEPHAGDNQAASRLALRRSVNENPGDQILETPLCKPASIDAARSLMLSLFPKAAFFETADISNSDINSCLRRVDMMTDWANPATRGTVYVLADGKHFLNGPLMSQATVLAESPKRQPVNQPQNDRSATSSDAPDGVVLLARALGLLDKYESIAEEEMTVDAQKADLLDALSIMPNQTIYHAGNPNTIYVVYDTGCPRCHEFFAMQDDIAEKYAAQLVWIPTYLNDTTRHVAAGLVEATAEWPEKAQEILAAVMRGDLSDLPDSPSDEAYAQLEITAGYLRQLSVEHGLGTPLIVFRHANGAEIEVLNGVPPLTEFAPLAPGA